LGFYLISEGFVADFSASAAAPTGNQFALLVVKMSLFDDFPFVVIVFAKRIACMFLL